MAKVYYTTQALNSSSGATNNLCLSARAASTATEANIQMPIVTSGGDFSKLGAYVASNTLNGTATIFLRVDTGGGPGNGSNTVSILTTQTGLFQDTTNTDSVNSGDKVNYQFVTAGSSGAVSVQYICIDFLATTNTFQNFILTSWINSTVATNESSFNDAGSNTISEAQTQFKMKSGGTFQKAFVKITANTQGNTVSYRLRVDGANGNIVIPVTAGATGTFSDTSNTDVVSSGSLVNFASTNGDTLNSITASIVVVEFLTTDSTFYLVSGSSATAGTSIAADASRYIGVGQALSQNSSTEANRSTPISFNFTASDLELYVVTNGGTTNGLCDLRVDTGGGPGSSALTIAVTALTTGYFEDATHTVDLNADDKIDIRYVAGSTAATTIGNMGFKATVASASSVKTVNGLAIASVKTINGLAVASVKTFNGAATQ